MHNRQKYSRLMGDSPARLILTGLLITTVLVVLTTGIAVWYSSTMRPYEHTTMLNVADLEIQEEDYLLQAPWEVKGLEPKYLNSAPPSENMTCTIYKWSALPRLGAKFETLLVNKGQDTRLECKSKWHTQIKGKGVTWFFNGLPIPSQNKKYYFLQDGSLKIHRVHESESGLYTCFYQKDTCYVRDTVRKINVKILTTS